MNERIPCKDVDFSKLEACPICQEQLVSYRRTHTLKKMFTDSETWQFACGLTLCSDLKNLKINGNCKNATALGFKAATTI